MRHLSVPAALLAVLALAGCSSTIETALTGSGFTTDAAVNVITGAGVLLCSDQWSKVINGW